MIYNRKLGSARYAEINTQDYILTERPAPHSVGLFEQGPMLLLEFLLRTMQQ